MKKVLDFWRDLWYNNGIMNTANDYISYISTILYFKNLPLWKRQLYSYENSDHRPVTLPPSSMEAAHKALASLPKADYWALSFNLDTFDDFIEEIS